MSDQDTIDSNPRRIMSKFLESPKTKEFVNEIVNNEKSQRAEMQHGVLQPVIKEIQVQEGQRSKMTNGDFKPVIITKGKNTTNFLADLKSA